VRRKASEPSLLARLVQAVGWLVGRCDWLPSSDDHEAGVGMGRDANAPVPTLFAWQWTRILWDGGEVEVVERERESCVEADHVHRRLRVSVCRKRGGSGGGDGG
jgi:hypothetical protein